MRFFLTKLVISPCSTRSVRWRKRFFKALNGPRKFFSRSVRQFLRPIRQWNPLFEVIWVILIFFQNIKDSHRSRILSLTRGTDLGRSWLDSAAVYVEQSRFQWESRTPAPYVSFLCEAPCRKSWRARGVNAKWYFGRSSRNRNFQSRNQITNSKAPVDVNYTLHSAHTANTQSSQSILHHYFIVLIKTCRQVLSICNCNWLWFISHVL